MVGYGDRTEHSQVPRPPNPTCGDCWRCCEAAASQIQPPEWTHMDSQVDSQQLVDRAPCYKASWLALTAIFVLVLVGCAASESGSGTSLESISAEGPSLEGTSTTAPNGQVDCDSDLVITMQASILPDAEGVPTVQGALEDHLSSFGGGAIEYIGGRTGSLVVDGKERVVASATEAPAGGWVVLTTRHCEGYRASP